MVIIAAVTSERFRREIKKPRPLIVRSKDEANRFVVPPFFVPDSHPEPHQVRPGNSGLYSIAVTGKPVVALLMPVRYATPRPFSS